MFSTVPSVPPTHSRTVLPVGAPALRHDDAGSGIRTREHLAGVSTHKADAMAWLGGPCNGYIIQSPNKGGCRKAEILAGVSTAIIKRALRRARLFTCAALAARWGCAGGIRILAGSGGWARPVGMRHVAEFRPECWNAVGESARRSPLAHRL